MKKDRIRFNSPDKSVASCDFLVDEFEGLSLLPLLKLLVRFYLLSSSVTACFMIASMLNYNNQSLQLNSRSSKMAGQMADD